MKALIVRASTEADIPAITRIYAYHVLNGTASFEIDAPDENEIARRRCDLENHGLPYIVAEQDGTVLGYAYAGPYRARPAYRYTVEDSIYVDPSYTGMGIGRSLLSALIPLCEQRNCRQMIAVIGGANNAPSIRLHERFGFAQAGVLKAVGFKFGAWIDTVLMQRSLGLGASAAPSVNR